MTSFSRVNHIEHVETINISAYKEDGTDVLVLPTSYKDREKSQWLWRIQFDATNPSYNTCMHVRASCTVEDQSKHDAGHPPIPIHWGIEINVQPDQPHSPSCRGGLDTERRFVERPYGVFRFVYAESCKSLTLRFTLRASENGNFIAPVPISNTEDKRRQSDIACTISALVQSLGSLLTSGLLSDVTLRTKQGDVAAHRSILAARSDFFKSKFKPEWQGVDAIVVDVSDVSLPVLKAMLRFIYTGSYGDNNVDIIKLLVAADMYLVTDLCNKIKKELEKSLESGNPIAPVCDLLKTSATDNSTSLRAVVLKYMKKHQKFLKSKEWIAFHTANRQVAAEATLDMINLPD